MKLIDVIIPAYNSHKTIDRTLYSICYQEISDLVNVYIINDFSDIDYTKEVQFFSQFIDIFEIKLEKNVGPGIARDIGLKNTNSKYIVFIDSDDIFASPIALKTLLNNIESNNSDIVIGRFIEEGKNSFIQHEDDTIWLHGKIYKREFLEKNNIEFNYNASRANEDTGFNQLIFLNNPLITYIDDPIYFWVYTYDSITTKDNEIYKVEGVIGYIQNMIYALEKAIENNADEIKIAEVALSTMYASYYYYLESDNEEVICKSARLKKIYEKYQVDDLYEKENIITSQLEVRLAKTYNKKSLYSMKITFEEFLSLVEQFE